MISSLRQFIRGFWRNARTRILMWATLTGVLCGLTGIGLPVEDILINARNYLRLHPSKGDIVMVLQDSRTLQKLDAMDVSRADDAKVLDNLFKAGARRVFFDRALSYYDSTAANKVFIDSLQRHSGKVYLGAMPSSDGTGGNYAAMLPAKPFRDRAEMVSLLAAHHPFNLGMSLPYSSNSPVGNIPALAAKIAGVHGGTGDVFRPDYSIDHKTIPALSYIDVEKGVFSGSVVNGKDVIIAPGAINYNDLHPLAGQGFVAGGYFHAIAAETLERGLPVNLGWLPPFLIVLAILVTGLKRGQVLDVYRFSGLTVVLIAAPFVLDFIRIEVAVFPALACASVAVFRMRNLDRVEVAGETNLGSGLPSVHALRNSAARSGHILVALKIRNYGAIIGSFSEKVEAQLADEIVRRIRISDSEAEIYHEGGMFMWLSSISQAFDISENLEGLHRIVQNGIRVGGLDVDLSFNCGIDSEFDRLLSSRVAGAMQAAEEAVRNDELVYHSQGEKQESQWEISLLTSLDRAIDNGEVWVAYQPKFDLRSNRVCGAEALVRWTHPVRGPIGPDKFIRIAEEFHRIERITRFVLDDAVRCAKALEVEGHDMAIAVNISAQLLRNPGLPNMIGQALEAHDLSPDRLVLEITETDRLDRTSKTFQMLQRLVQMGLRLSIDDFGTGNATIDYLRYLPASEVKIDKVFVSAMETSKEDLLLVQSIIEMAHSLDRTVVAEGVETAVVLEMLRARGCDLVQGYHIGRPVPFRDFQTQIGQEGARRTG
ncbi:EAL domain-containing protein [Novosphingobium sp. 9]|uniref:EAL domain-containing protein n=1 Tax=Novosphingobium sp. 9 TaxID=2025349 RepID=UPI0021B5FBE4|nr:EAL domain-containing protein [Novosphingobium sp. 9]